MKKTLNTTWVYVLSIIGLLCCCIMGSGVLFSAPAFIMAQNKLKDAQLSPDDYEGDYSQRRTLIWTLNFTVKTYLFGPVDAARDIRKVTLDYRTDTVRRPAELRYSAEVASTDTPPKARDEINPATDAYTAVETFEDIYSNDQDFFGLGDQ